MVGDFMDECLVKMDEDCKDVLIGLINIELNDNLTVIKANSIYYNLVGYTQDEFKDDFNSSLLKITYYKDKDKLVHKLLYNSKEESYINIEFRVVKKNGDLAWLSINGYRNHDDQMVDLLNTYIADITYIKNENERLRAIVDTMSCGVSIDSLTGLYNKDFTKKNIEEYLLGEGRNKRHCFMITDIDDFKDINDNLGHMVGDSVLAETGCKVKSLIRRDDIIGRVGGDGFVVFIKDIKNKDIIYDKANEICKAFRETCINGDDNYKISCSIGISIYPSDGTTYDELFKKADLALNNVKYNGKDCFQIHNNYMERVEQVANSVENPNVDKRIVSIVVNNFLKSESIKDGINKALEIIGNYYGVSRTYIFENSDDGKYCRNTYEWCADGINPQIDNLQKIDVVSTYTYDDYFDEDGILHFRDIEILKNYSPELYEILNKQGIKAILQCKINEEFKGFIGFDDCERKRFWEISEIRSLMMLSKIITGYIVKLRKSEKLEKENLLTRAIVDSQGLWAYVVNPKTYKLQYISPRIKQSLPGVEVGMTCHEYIGGNSILCKICPIAELSGDTKMYTRDIYDIKSYTWVNVRASRFEWIEGEESVLICCSDITKYVETVTYTDMLTRISTLSRFQIEAEKILKFRKNNKYALVYCDFDRFKNINDELGYEVGNRILIGFGKILVDEVGDNELACRASEDKFILLLKYEEIEEIKLRLAYIAEKVEDMRKDKFISCKLAITSGVYVIQPEDKDLSIIMDRANIARKTRKGVHENTCVIYDNRIHQKIKKENKIENRMFYAVNNKEFLVYLQPKVDIKTRKFVGAEALVRWKLSDGTIMPPVDFIPVLERNGFIVNLDFYVYEEVFSTIRRWIDEKKQVIPISVNVSRVHLKDSRFTERLFGLVNKYKIPTNLIELELTESVFLEDTDNLMRVMNELKTKGFILSIDDFGSGYSSLNLLKDLPVDTLKLDKEFFKNGDIDINVKTIVSYVIKMAKSLGLVVLFEGIETESQAKFLIDNDCDLAQGYLFAKPMPIDDFEKMVFK